MDVIITVFIARNNWFKTLQCIDDVNKLLQYADISIADEVKQLVDLQKEPKPIAIPGVEF